ncbi:Shedu anti-phage system protein SduA domain-containing protein [Vibrio parahaemolyticus]|uniref:Shedu anti-phage system protein SduA domain-containing protein n=1 Tax=Vibrio parahaemolyticus TaxID=670 RepID=UPI001E4591AB|nr:Shedu anti-phage system protein SduA domain-containing protein [Vibrio parahaemolyticus]
MTSNNRDYRFLTPEETDEWEKVKQEEIVNPGSRVKIRKNLFSKYPRAARHFQSLFPNQYLDTMDLKDTDNIQLLLKGFIDLLNKSDVRERDILNYINSEPAFFIIGSLLKKYYNFGHHAAHLFREFPLGTSYKADYLLVGKNSDGWHFVFVELESPNGSVTTLNGDLGTVFRKGKAQIEDWEFWLERNYSVFQEFFKKHKKLDDPLPEEFCHFDRSRINYVVIAGRRGDFNDKTYRIQRQSIRNNQIHLIHYDNLIDAVELLSDSCTY